MNLHLFRGWREEWSGFSTQMRLNVPLYVTMIVSRGLARETTRVPMIFSRPELVGIDLE